MDEEGLRRWQTKTYYCVQRLHIIERAHRSPNLGQVPSAGSPYGKECRSLFGPPEGWVLCGTDLSGIEVRCLASYLHPYDNGEYAKQILEGDIHTYNQKAAGLETRNQAKTWLYATLYGAGDSLIGQIAGGKAALGRKLKQNYDKAVPAFATLKKRLKKAYGRGYIKAIDGRKLQIRSEHRCLSQLLQSCGAIVSKQWVMMTYDEIKKQHGNDAFIMGWIHDEMQIACRNNEVANNVGNISRRMAEASGTALGLKISIAAEYSVGKLGLTHIEVDDHVSNLVALYIVLDRAWRSPFTVKSDFARKSAMHVAIAASEGFITTKVDTDTWGSRWCITDVGMETKGEVDEVLKEILPPHSPSN